MSKSRENAVTDGRTDRRTAIFIRRFDRARGPKYSRRFKAFKVMLKVSGVSETFNVACNPLCTSQYFSNYHISTTTDRVKTTNPSWRAIDCLLEFDFTSFDDSKVNEACSRYSNNLVGN